MLKYNFYQKNRFSIIPLIGTTKVAAVKNWQTWSNELSPYKIDDLLDDNIGIVTGVASDLIVLDIDNPILFGSFCKRHGYQVPKSFMVKTGKGFHVYFRYPKDGKEYRCKAYSIFGFDIRAVGGYVVGPYSIHEPTGKMYEIVNDGVIQEAPEWLLTYCFGGDRSPVPNIEKLNIPESMKELITTGAEKGHRSETIMRVINSLVAKGLKDDQIFYIFNIYKIGEKYLEKPSDIRDQWLQEHIDKAKAFLNNYEEDCKVPVSDDMLEITYASGSDMIAKECNVTWLIPDLLELLGHTIITGKAGTGKSMYSLNLALALASGSNFMGFDIDKPLKIVIIQCENSEPFMKQRLKRLVEIEPSYSKGLDNIHFIYFDGRHDNPKFKLTNNNLEAMIQKIHDDKHPDLIILDPYKSYSGVEENSNDSNREVLDKLFFILGKYGITSIIIHHEGKASEYTDTARSRGASAITDTVSNHWGIRRVKEDNSCIENIVISCAKARNYQKFDDIYLKVVDGMYFNYLEDPHDPQKLVEILAGNNGSVDTQTEMIKLVMEGLKVKELQALRMIKRAIESKLIVSEKYGQNKKRYQLPIVQEVV